MPNSLQSSVIASPASRRATNCNLSSMTEHSFQGITPSSLEEESVTHVFGTIYYLCLRPLSCTVRRDPLQNVPKTCFTLLGQKGFLRVAESSPQDRCNRDHSP